MTRAGIPTATAVRQIGGDDRVRTEHDVRSDGHSFGHRHLGPEPDVVTDAHRIGRTTLIQDGAIGVGERMIVVWHRHHLGQQAAAADHDALVGGHGAVVAEDGPVPDVDHALGTRGRTLGRRHTPHQSELGRPGPPGSVPSNAHRTEGPTQPMMAHPHPPEPHPTAQEAANQRNPTEVVRTLGWRGAPPARLGRVRPWRITHQGATAST
jgi:hypothetical protein